MEQLGREKKNSKERRSESKGVSSGSKRAREQTPRRCETAAAVEPEPSTSKGVKRATEGGSARKRVRIQPVATPAKLSAYELFGTDSEAEDEPEITHQNKNGVEKVKRSRKPRSSPPPPPTPEPSTSYYKPADVVRAKKATAIDLFGADSGDEQNDIQNNANHTSTAKELTAFLPTVQPLTRTSEPKTETTTDNHETTSRSVVTQATVEKFEGKQKGRLLNLNVDELQNYANALHNQTQEKVFTKPLTDLSDVNLDGDEEDTPVMLHGKHHDHKEIPNDYYHKMKVPYKPLFTMMSPETETCKENGITYSVGEHINRGCEELCECTKGGKFECGPRCKHPYIRRGRRLDDPLCFESPIDECCSIIACATGNGENKPTKLEVCRHNNETHPVGASWNVGCEQKCSCEPNSVISCKPRCNVIVPSEKCINVQDPNDTCCEVQICDVSQDVHEEHFDNVTATSNTSTTTTEDTQVYEDRSAPKSTSRPLVLNETISSVEVLQNNSVKVNFMHPKRIHNPIHLQLSDDGGKSFKDLILNFPHTLDNLSEGKEYILKTKETENLFNFRIPLKGNETEAEINTGKEGCNHDGKFYSIGEEFHIGCTELCECTGPETKECVELVCPNHVGLELVSKGCVQWAPNPPLVPPNCCPRTARCLSDGTCHFKGIAIPNWSEVPISLTGCEQRCFCENGELDCQEVCTSLPPVPPQNFRCPPMHHPAPVNASDDDCCKKWGCVPNKADKKDGSTQSKKRPHSDNSLSFINYVTIAPTSSYMLPTPILPTVPLNFYENSSPIITSPKPTRNPSFIHKTKQKVAVQQNQLPHKSKPIGQIENENNFGAIKPQTHDIKKSKIKSYAPFLPTIPPDFASYKFSSNTSHKELDSSYFDKQVDKPTIYAINSMKVKENPNQYSNKIETQTVVTPNSNNEKDHINHEPQASEASFKLDVKESDTKSPMTLEQILNEMEMVPKVSKELQWLVNNKTSNAAGHTPSVSDLENTHPQQPFLPTIPPNIHFPSEEVPDYDENLHRPDNSVIPNIPNIPISVPPNYGEENKKLSVISIQADSPTSVKLLFGLPPVLVGLRGSVDLRYTDSSDDDISHWYSQVFAPADEVLTTPRLEFRLSGLKPSTMYRIRGKLYLHNLPVEPQSDIYSVRTLDLPTVAPIEEKRKEIDSRLTVVDVNDTVAHVSWRHFTEEEMQFIDGIQVRYRPVGTPIYSMTELLHHSRSIAELQELRPGTRYEASLILVPPPRATTELIDPGMVEFTTAPYVDPYNWSVIIEARAVGSNAAELTWSGVPSPAERWVRVYRGAHACGTSRKEHDAFRLATRDLPPTLLLPGLESNSRCRVWLELFLTNGKIKTSNVLEISTLSEEQPSDVDNKIEASSIAGSRGDARGDYYGALVVVGVVAALGALTSLLLLLILVRRHRPRSVPITPVPSGPRDSTLPPYDNPAYKLEIQQETMDL